MKITQVIRRAALLKGNRTALIFADQEIGWSEFSARIARLAGGLQTLGLQRGERVSILADACIEYFDFHFGVPWAGGAIVPLNTRLSNAELVEILDDAESKILIVDKRHAERAEYLLANACTLETIVNIGETAENSYTELLKNSEPIDDQPADRDDIIAIVYTGGTTGRAKGVALSHANVVANALVAINTMEFHADMVYLHTTPLFHTAGSGRVFSTATAAATGVILPRFDEKAVLDAIATHRVTHLLLVPTMINRLLNHPDFDHTDLTSLTNISYGASIMPEVLLRDIVKKLPNVRFTQSYGMTELSPSAAYLPPEYHVLEGPSAGKLTSVGIPVHSAEIRIADEHDRPLPANEIGEIQVTGPMVMQGYWKQPELTAKTLAGGWMHTGDAGYMDEDGFIFLVDRIKDMIISGGENIYSGEVENTIYEHPSVKECAVIGIPDADWGERVHAIVVLHTQTELDEQQLISHCRERIAGYKCPRSVEFRSDPLPLSSTNKILKSELRKPYLE